MAENHGNTTDTITTTHTEHFGEELTEKGAYCDAICDKKFQPKSIVDPVCRSLFMPKWAWIGSTVVLLAAVITIVIASSTRAGKTEEWQANADQHFAVNDKRLDAIEDLNGKKMDKIMQKLGIQP